jgi:hypothetical protein
MKENSFELKKLNYKNYTQINKTRKTINQKNFEKKFILKFLLNTEKVQ